MRNFIKINGFIFLFFVTTTALAKDLNHRLGIGFKDNTSLSVPSVAGVYYPLSDIAFTGGLGIDTLKNNSKFQVHAGIRKIIFTEANLNFYAGGQLSLVNYENPATGKQGGIEIQSVFGAEFFLSGLENLGFTFEAGLGLASLADFQVRTVADGPTRAGVIFYF